MAKAEKAKESVSQKQTDFIVNNFDKLAPAYQKYFNNLTEEQDKNLSFNVASDAIRGMVAREKLKNYLPKFDNRWKTMDTREAEALALECERTPASIGGGTFTSMSTNSPISSADRSLSIAVMISS